MAMVEGNERAYLAVGVMFEQRANFQEMRGKKRDLAAMEFIAGATAVAVGLGNDELAEVLGILCALVGARGAGELTRLAHKAADQGGI